jgi:cell division protein FtsB
VDPALVARDDKNRVYTVRYEAVNAMLLNEFQKEHRTIEEQSHSLSQQSEKIQGQDAMIQDLKQSVAELRNLVQSLARPQTASNTP